MEPSLARSTRRPCRTLTEACPRGSDECLKPGLWAKDLWFPAAVAHETQPSASVARLVSIAQDENKDYRPYMEDGHCVLDPLPQQGEHHAGQWGLFAVYDGHGSDKEMKFCEAQLHSLVAAELRESTCTDSSCIGNALACAFGKADAELERLGSFRSGCTATVALATRLSNSGVEIHVGNVGDSRALLVGAFGTRRLSIDHRTTQCSELTRIKDVGGFVYNRRVSGVLAVTRSLGDHYLKPSVSGEPDICSYNHSDSSCDDTVALVIASDGLWDSVEDDEVEEVLTKCLSNAAVAKASADVGAKAEAVTKLQVHSAQALVDQAKARGSRDNIKVLVAFF